MPGHTKNVDGAICHEKLLSLVQRNNAINKYPIRYLAFNISIIKRLLPHCVLEWQGLGQLGLVVVLTGE